MRLTLETLDAEWVIQTLRRRERTQKAFPRYVWNGWFYTQNLCCGLINRVYEAVWWAENTVGLDGKGGGRMAT